MDTAYFDDGYNGHKVLCFIKPLNEDKNGNKLLRVAEPGKTYMIKWCSLAEYLKVLSQVV